jgi:raffinose/stachyose/melibiose transport system permease protein
MSGKSIRKYLEPTAFVLPGLVLLGLFVYYPLVQNFIFSLYRFSVFSPEKSYVGFTNYQRLFHDKIILVSLANNLRYAVVSEIFQVCFGLVLAAILEDTVFRKIAPFFRTVFFLPVVISIAVVCLIFGFIYNPTNGLLNQFLTLVGLGGWARPWLGSGRTAIWATIVVSQWQSTGYIMMLFIVAIQKIPRELYEAAEIDGAGKLRQFFIITLPQVREMFFVTSVITVTGSILVFNEPYIMTKGGGPGSSSMTLVLHMYQSGFFKDMMGYAATIAVVIFLISALLAVLQMVGFRSGND